jgi:hypothetical protein
MFLGVSAKGASQKVAIEIFQMPLFLLKPLKLGPNVISPTEMSERDLMAHRAYVRNEEIPPLIPA